MECLSLLWALRPNPTPSSETGLHNLFLFEWQQVCFAFDCAKMSTKLLWVVITLLTSPKQTSLVTLLQRQPSLFYHTWYRVNEQISWWKLPFFFLFQFPFKNFYISISSYVWIINPYEDRTLQRIPPRHVLRCSQNPLAYCF
jgi:hypothetical protein